MLFALLQLLLSLILTRIFIGRSVERRWSVREIVFLKRGSCGAAAVNVSRLGFDSAVLIFDRWVKEESTDGLCEVSMSSSV